mgnify:CR=1 FL=1
MAMKYDVTHHKCENTLEGVIMESTATPRAAVEAVRSKLRKHRCDLLVVERDGELFQPLMCVSRHEYAVMANDRVLEDIRESISNGELAEWELREYGIEWAELPYVRVLPSRQLVICRCTGLWAEEHAAEVARWLGAELIHEPVAGYHNIYRWSWPLREFPQPATWDEVIAEIRSCGFEVEESRGFGGEYYATLIPATLYGEAQLEMTAETCSRQSVANYVAEMISVSCGDHYRVEDFPTIAFERDEAGNWRWVAIVPEHCPISSDAKRLVKHLRACGVQIDAEESDEA